MLNLEAKQETATRGRVRGFMAEARLLWVGEYFGERVLQRVLALLPPPAAEETAAAVSRGWCSLETLERLDSAIAEVCGRNERQVLRDLGRYAAHVARSPEYRPMRGENLHHFFQSTVVRDALFLKSARGSYERLGSERGRLSIFTAPAVSAAWCHSLTGYLEQIVIGHGGRDAAVIETACRSSGSDACTFEVGWRGSDL